MDDNKPTRLEIVSDQSQMKNLEKRHLPRLNLAAEQFRLVKENKIFPITDISQKGMCLCLLDPDDHRLFFVGAEIEGIMNLKREKFHIKARIRNLYSERVGCEFEDLSKEAESALLQLMDPVALGKQLKPIPSPRMSSLWYHGPSGTDLVLARLPDGQFENVALYALGNYVEWDQKKSLVTGRTLLSDKKSEMHGILRMETLYLEPDASPSLEKLGIAKTIVLSSNLPQELRNWCVRHFER